MPPPALFVDDRPSGGEGAPLAVLVHGSMDRHSSFARVRAEIADSCRVLSYDRRGYARSREAAPPARGLDDHVADLEALLAGRRATLVGHSYGGTVVLTLAARRPGLVASLVAYEPPLSWLEWWPAHGGERQQPFGAASAAEAAAAFVQRMIGAERYARLPASSRAELGRDGPALVAELTALRTDPAPFAPEAIAVPAIIARGGQATPHQVAATDLLVARMPDARLQVVAGAGHAGHRSHPVEFAALVREAVALGSARDPGTVGGGG